jgi:hypothetical protein
LAVGLLAVSSAYSVPAYAENRETGPIAYARCMRANGFPDFPDPQSEGTVRMLAVDKATARSAAFVAADEKCRPYLGSDVRHTDDASEPVQAPPGGTVTIRRYPPAK